MRWNVVCEFSWNLGLPKGCQCLNSIVRFLRAWENKRLFWRLFYTFLHTKKISPLLFSLLQRNLFLRLPRNEIISGNKFSRFLLARKFKKNNVPTNLHKTIGQLVYRRTIELHLTFPLILPYLNGIYCSSLSISYRKSQNIIRKIWYVKLKYYTKVTASKELWLIFNF